MRDQSVILQTNYVSFVFNGGVETVQFDNFEIVGDLEYFPPTTQEIQQSESGATFSLARKQVEKFRFEFNYDNRKTRAKVETIRKYIAAGYQLEFTVQAFPTIFTGSDFPTSIPTADDPEVLTQTITFSKAVISLPSDFSFDRSARGEGMTILDGIECIVSKSATLPVPTSECSLVSAADFDFTENVDPGTLELISFTLSPDAGGLIGTIDGTVTGTITYISGGSGQGSTSSTISYNGAQSRYEPDSGPFILDGLYTITLNGIPITLGSGQVCSFDFQTSLQYFVNTAPVASDVLISGTPREGEALSLSWSYSDAQNDAEDTTPVDREVWFSFPTESEANSGDLTNATQLGTGNAYTVGSGIVGEFIAARVKPYAQTGASPGTEVFSNVIGPISGNVVAYNFQNNKSGNFELIQEFSTPETIGIDWGDGTFETFNSLTGDQTYQHTYASGTRTVNVYTDATKVVDLNLDTEDILSLDISNLSSLGQIFASVNSGFRTLNPPTANTASWGIWRTYQNDLLGTLDFSGFTNPPSDIWLHLNSSLSGVTFPASSAAITRFWCYSTSISALDFSSSNIGGDIRIHSNPSLASASFGGATNTTTVTFFQAFNTALSSLDVSALLLSGSFQVSANSSLQSLTLPTNSNTFSQFYAHLCDLQGTLNLSSLTGLGGDIRFRGNPDLSGVTFPATSQLVTNLEGYNCSLTSVDLSPLSNLSGNVEFRQNTSLVTVTMPGSNATGISNLDFSVCNIEYFSLLGNTFLEGVTIYLNDNSLTATEVDHFLVDLDATLPATGTGTIDLSGTNAAPTDGTTTTYDGIAAAAALTSKGYTVITS